MRFVERVRAKLRRILRLPEVDYREALFQDLVRYLDGVRPARILEIGPRDGLDTRRLLRLAPDRLVLVDLPRRKADNEVWLRELDGAPIEYISANFMYTDAIDGLARFDCVWCTGVLYHNPEQLRMIRRLYDLLRPGGVLALETATIRRRALRDHACVEILYPPSPELCRRFRLSPNITHLPSASAVASWLALIGFEQVLRSACHRQVSAALARNRVAYLARRPARPSDGRYYALDGEEGFVVGKSL
jgi:SAM-dependent methyltransferase